RLRRRHGHGDRDPHRRHQGRHGPRAGRRGSGRRFRCDHGASRDPVEGGRRPARRRVRRHAPPGMSAPRPAARRPRPGRRTTVLAGTAASALLAGTTRLTWIDAAAPDLTGTLQQVDVPGAEAAPAVLALALVAIAASLATSLPSALLRFVTGPVLVLTGGGAALAALRVVLDPSAAAGSAVAGATDVISSGLEAYASTSALRTHVPVLAVVAGGLLLLTLVPALAVAAVGVLVLVAGGSWPRRDRYRSAAVAVAADPSEDPAAAWDALTRGEDPSLEEHGTERPAPTDPDGTRGRPPTRRSEERRVGKEGRSRGWLA